jgi:hypothetical protein
VGQFGNVEKGQCGSVEVTGLPPCSSIPPPEREFKRTMVFFVKRSFFGFLTFLNCVFINKILGIEDKTEINP